MVLYKHCQERQYNQMRFEAAIHGVDLDKEAKKAKPAVIQEMEGAKTVDLEFKDLKEYEHLSQDERESMTREMMHKLKMWAEKPMSTGTDGKVFRTSTPIGR